ncbi:MAG: non-ribosomal peptide synthetase, partial [Acidobacteriota bacterium]
RDEQTTTAIPQPRDRELRVITVDSSRDLSETRHDPSTPQPARGSVDALAYVIYTSGSTGKPKGSLIAHRNVAQLLAATRRLFRCSPEDIWTLFHSYAFDFSVWELWGALAHGGRLVVVPRLVSRSPDDFRQLLTRQRVSILNQTPSAFLQLAPSLIEASRRGAESSPQQVSMRQVCLKQVPLRQVIFGGEALEPARLRPWLDHFGDGRHDSGPRLINMYGITETTVHVTYRVLERDDAIPSDAAASPAGRALDHLALHLLDRRGHPVPIGVPGEIYVGGEGLGRGYLDRSSLTAERFVPADGHRGGERLYRSGDLARWLARGEIDFLGRIDQQIKIRGFRIELGEIEANLAAHPEIRDVAVLPRHASATAEDQRLVAYLVARENEGDTVLLPQSGEPTSDAKAQPTAGELRSFLAQSLPEYMIPAAFVPLEALPLTPHGKLDRAALPNPDGERPDLGQAYVPPRRAIETVLCEVWAEMLEVERVGIEDNFFDLGGHSLLVTQVTSWVRETFEVEVSLQTFFAAPTVAALAMAMQEDPASQQRVQRTAELLLELSDDEADEAV